MKRPNIIFLMTDQQRWDALGCENTLIQTPCLDALARSGVRYRQAVCQNPMCLPSRYSMMTGLYTSQIGTSHNGACISRDADIPVPTLMQRLSDAGYQTASFGKTHWYHARCHDSKTPSKRGAEVCFQARGKDPESFTPDTVLMEEQDPDKFARLKKETSQNGPGGEWVTGYIGRRSALPDTDHREGWLRDQCSAWLQGHQATESVVARDPDRPLFLYLSLDFPHAGLNPPAKYEDLYDIDDICERPLPPWDGPGDEHRPCHIEGFYEAWKDLTPEQRRWTTLRYYAATSFVDECFRQVLQTCEDTGLLEDAIILFTSDHGEMLGDRAHRFSKYCLYDPSVRVPLVLSGSRLPEELKGTTDERPSELVDVLPTLCKVAGIEIPDYLPGGSLLEAPCRLGTFSQMNGAGSRNEPSQRAPSLMWRKDGYKLILTLPGSVGNALTRLNEIKGELYDLNADPDEWFNQYDNATFRDRRETMTRELLFHIACTQAKFPRHQSQIGLSVNEPEAVGETSPETGFRYWY